LVGITVIFNDDNWVIKRIMIQNSKLPFRIQISASKLGQQ